MVLNEENLKREVKKIKKYNYEKGRLNMILNHIKLCETYNDLSLNPISKMYGFEKLKYKLQGFVSFNLCKNGGMIRLICSVDISNNTVKIEKISMNHYEDIKRWGVYYEKN